MKNVMNNRFKLIWERFFKGESSLEEEKTLQETFQKDAYFEYIKKQHTVSCNYSWEELTQKEAAIIHQSKTVPLFNYFGFKHIAIALLLIISFSALFTLYYKKEPTLIVKNGEIIKDQKTAKQETEKVFILLSEKLGKTKTRIHHINKKLIQ